MKNIGKNVREILGYLIIALAIVVWLGVLMVLAYFVDVEFVVMVLISLFFIAWLIAPVFVWQSIASRRRSKPAQRQAVVVPTSTTSKTTFRVIGG